MPPRRLGPDPARIQAARANPSSPVPKCAASCRGIRIVSASAGVTHSMALGADGSLYTWGDGRYGQLGHVEVQAMAAVDPQHGVVVSTPQKIRTLDPQPLPPQDRQVHAVPCRGSARLARARVAYAQLGATVDPHHASCCCCLVASCCPLPFSGQFPAGLWPSSLPRTQHAPKHILNILTTRCLARTG